jgi:hypothetical protein
VVEAFGDRFQISVTDFSSNGDLNSSAIIPAPFEAREYAVEAKARASSPDEEPPAETPSMCVCQNVKLKLKPKQ